jgi:hypothetical protein
MNEMDFVAKPSQMRGKYERVMIVTHSIGMKGPVIFTEGVWCLFRGEGGSRKNVIGLALVAPSDEC